MKNLSDAATARNERVQKMRKSPQYRNGKFHNILDPKEDLWAALKKWAFAKPEAKVPKQPLPIVKRKRDDFDVTLRDSLRVTWLGHSSLLVEIDGARFLTDPVWGERSAPVSFAGPKRFFEPPLPLNEIPKLDAIVLSHDHYDHFCSETLTALKNLNVPFIVPLGVGNRLENLGVHHSFISEYDWWDELEISKVKLACTPARHFSGRSLTDRNSTLWCSWTFIGKSRRFFFSGDTAMTPQFVDIGLKYGPFDVVAMESGAYDAAWADVHIGPEQAVQAFLNLSGKVFLPIHWATFDLALHGWTEPGERLLVAAKKQNVNLVLPKPGESFECGHIDSRMTQKWWPEEKWRSADENPIVSSGL